MLQKKCTGFLPVSSKVVVGYDTTRRLTTWIVYLSGVGAVACGDVYDVGASLW